MPRTVTERSLNETIVKRAAHLRLKALTLARDMKAGSFRSLYRGQGIEFSGVREYLYGDDVRAIDRNVSARMGKPFIKMFQEERELVTFIVLDCSSSMSFSSRMVSETASLAALAGDCGGCPVGAVIFAGDILFSCAPRQGAVMPLLSRFDSMCNADKDGRFSAMNGTIGSALPQALSGAAKLLKKRALVFVISDFRVSGWERPFSLLCAKHDVIALRVTNPLSESQPPVLRVTFIDPETGLTQTLPTSNARFRREWKADNEMRSARHIEAVVSRGGYPLEISADDDPFVSLSRFFAARGDS
jgi:uncharacterized protein (DUF58 family)